jgi:NDP-sugar pyrophosphorylase family protein
MLGEGQRVRAVVIEGFWSDVASPQAALELNGAMILDRQPDGLLISPSARIAPGARLVPPVYIGPDCEVGAAEVGPDVCLLEGARVADGARLSRCMLYATASVPAPVQVEMAVLEEGQQARADLVGASEAVAVLPE